MNPTLDYTSTATKLLHAVADGGVAWNRPGDLYRIVGRLSDLTRHLDEVVAQTGYRCSAVDPCDPAWSALVEATDAVLAAREHIARAHEELHHAETGLAGLLLDQGAAR